MIKQRKVLEERQTAAKTARQFQDGPIIKSKRFQPLSAKAKETATEVLWSRQTGALS